jgi:hypothetical protein
MRPYIVRHLIGTGAAAVVVVALSGGWLVYDAVAQVDDAADDDILTVGQCIDANASFRPVEEALVKEDIIEKDLLQTNVTNGMCEDMLEQVTDGTPVRRLVAAQNYVQEIKLIEEAMRRAGGEATAKVTDAKGPDRHFLADEPLVLTRWTVLVATQSAAVAQQYSPSAPADGAPSPPADGDEGNAGGITPIKQQAAAAASVGEDNDASIAERLRQKEAAAINAGATVPEARASARCSTEVEVSDKELEKGKGLYEIEPQMPEEIRLRKTQQAGLLVSPVTKKRFEEIRQKHGGIDKESESGIGCVELVDRMKAQLVPLDLEGLSIYRRHPDDIRELSSNRSTRWGWDIVARQPGNLELLLDLRYAISQEGQEFRLVPQSPVFEGVIRVKPLQSGSSQESSQEATERPWWRRIFGGILERIFGVIGT